MTFMGLLSRRVELRRTTCGVVTHHSTKPREAQCPGRIGTGSLGPTGALLRRHALGAGDGRTAAETVQSSDDEDLHAHWAARDPRSLHVLDEPSTTVGSDRER